MLRGGPADGLTAPPPKPGDPWPERLCLNLRYSRVGAHYRHIAAGVYEYLGPCVEFFHGPQPAVRRCADCGSQIVGDPL